MGTKRFPRTAFCDFLIFISPFASECHHNVLQQYAAEGVYSNRSTFAYDDQGTELRKGREQTQITETEIFYCLGILVPTLSLCTGTT
jgi:hypothetical protein